MITVLGATGNTGRRVTARLLAEGEQVRAVGRSAGRLAATTAQPWVGDVTDLPVVAARDVGDAAAHALLAFDWTGTEVREVLGPCDLTLPEATRILGESIGMPELPYVRLPDAEMAGLLREAGLPGDLSDLQVAMNRAFNEKVVVSHRTPAATTPTTLRQWLQR